MKEGLFVSNLPEKVAVYMDFIDMFTKILRKQKTKREIDKIGTKMMNIGLNMMILASESVLSAFIYWKALSSEGSDSNAMIEAFGNVVLEMRKDIVGDTKRTADDAIGMFLRDLP
jgi:hypothetical protein